MPQPSTMLHWIAIFPLPAATGALLLFAGGLKDRGLLERVYRLGDGLQIFTKRRNAV
jgi:hypothetical protein